MERRLRSVTRANKHSACYSCLAWLVCHGPFLCHLLALYLLMSLDLGGTCLLSLANVNAFYGFNYHTVSLAQDCMGSFLILGMT